MGTVKTKTGEATKTSETDKAEKADKADKADKKGIAKKSIGNLKYPTAWDNVLKKFVKAEEVPEIESHDVYRFFSEQPETCNRAYIGDVLTVVKEAKRQSKTGRQFSTQRHFRYVDHNSKGYHDMVEYKKESQESMLHKVCKQLSKEISFIKLPEVKVNIAGTDIAIINEQYVKIKVTGTEIRDKETNCIPDITAEMEIMGTRQELFIEIVYKNEVHEKKRKAYRNFVKNCIAVDIYDIQSDLDMGEKQLQSLLKNRIIENSYWVSCGMQEVVTRISIPKYIFEISSHTILRESNLTTHRENPFKRYYFFRDEITLQGKLNESHPCYTDPNKIDKENKPSTDIGECKECKRCLGMGGYGSLNKENVRAYCNKHNTPVLQLANIIIQDGLKELQEYEVMKYDKTNN